MATQIEGICRNYIQASGSCGKDWGLRRERTDIPSLMEFPEDHQVSSSSPFETKKPLCAARGKGGAITEGVAFEQSQCTGYEAGPVRRERIIFYAQVPGKGGK